MTSLGRADALDLLDGSDFKVAIVLSRFNSDITEPMLENACRELTRLGVDAEDIHVYRVPGALEIPLLLQQLANTDADFDAMIAIGCVIRGDTYHFEVVCNEACRGVTQVQLEWGIPIANAILTVDNHAQAVARIVEKGTDAARVTIEMARMLESIDEAW